MDPLSSPPEVSSRTESRDSVDPRETWINQELELIVSGAVVVSLFQLPAVIEQWWLVREGQLGGSLAMAAFMLYYVGTLLTYGLIAAFGSHFLIRGYWVALVGLRSAFPGGVDWSAIELGESQRSYYQDRAPRLSALGDRVDRLASSIFAGLFLFLFTMTAKSLAVSLIVGVAWLLGRGIEALGGPDLTRPLGLGAFGLIQLASTLVGWVDRRERKDAPVPDWALAFTRRSLPLLIGPVSTRVVAPIALTFLSRTSRRALTIGATAFFYALVGFFLLNVLFEREVLTVDSYVYLPVNADEDSFQPRYYDNLRQGSASRIPTLSSDVVEGPYLRLFLPFDAREDNERGEARGPDLPAQRATGFLGQNPPPTPEPERRRILECIDRVYEVTLDGEVVRPDWIFARHPTIGGRGVLAQLPTEPLDAGRHLLTIRHRPLPGTEDDPEADKGRDVFHLPFWK